MVNTPVLEFAVAGNPKLPDVIVCVAEKLLAPRMAAVPAILEGAIAAEVLISAFTIVPSTISDDEIHGVKQFTSEAVPDAKFVSADPSPTNAIAFTLPF